MRPALKNIKLVNCEDTVMVTVVLIYLTTSSLVFCFDSRT